MTIEFNFRIKIPLVFIILSIAAGVYLDISNHGGFQKSVTGKQLKSSGVLDAYQTVEKEVRTKLPVYFASVYKAANIDRLKDGFTSGFRYLFQVSEPVTSWIHKTIPFKLEYANDVILPKLVDGFSKFTSDLSSYLATGQENVKVLSSNLVSWASENVNLDSNTFSKVQGTFSDIVHNIQSTVVDGFNWAQRQLVG